MVTQEGGTLESLWCYEDVVFCLHERIQEHLTPKLSTVPTLSNTFSINLFVYLEESGLFLPNDVHGEQSWPLVNMIFSKLNKPVLLMASVMPSPVPIKPSLFLI